MFKFKKRSIPKVGKIRYLGQYAAIRYYCVRYASGCLEKLPWGKAQFDCGIFVNPSSDQNEVERCIQEVIRKNNDWILTFGADSERWHDRIDNASVDIGRQKQVGDGDPMTAWIDDIKTLGGLDISCNFGGCDAFLLILIGFTEKTIQ